MPELVERSSGSRVRLPVSTTRLMLLVAMRLPPSRVLVDRPGAGALLDEPSSGRTRAGRRNRTPGEGNPSWVAAGPPAAMLEATGKDRRPRSTTHRESASGPGD